MKRALILFRFVFLFAMLSVVAPSAMSFFIAKSMNEMAAMLREGKVDLNFDRYARTAAALERRRSEDTARS